MVELILINFQSIKPWFNLSLIEWLGNLLENQSTCENSIERKVRINSKNLNEENENQTPDWDVLAVFQQFVKK